MFQAVVLQTKLEVNLITFLFEEDINLKPIWKDCTI